MPGISRHNRHAPECLFGLLFGLTLRAEVRLTDSGVDSGVGQSFLWAGSLLGGDHVVLPLLRVTAVPGLDVRLKFFVGLEHGKVNAALLTFAAFPVPR